MRPPVLSDDSLAITLLCTHLGSPRTNGVKPLSDGEWDAIAERIARSPLKTPRALFGVGSRELQADLGIDTPLADRMGALLARSGQVAFELERISSLGMWIMTRADADFPRDLKRRLRSRTPPVLFGFGDRTLLSSKGVAIVGSRDLDDRSLLFASTVGRAAARSGLTVYSGGSRGADLTAMRGALDEGGRVVGVLSDSLETSLRDPTTREHMTSGALCLASPFHPRAPFRAGNAMARNKIVYCLSTVAVVVATSDRKGGTWAGAVEALKARWIPVFVRSGQMAPTGNARLLEIGARPIPSDREDNLQGLVDWLHLTAEGVDDGSERVVLGDVVDAFDIVWPAIARFLASPRSQEEIAHQFRLVPDQVVVWLARAEAAQKARRLSSGWVVQSSDTHGQQALFSDL